MGYYFCIDQRGMGTAYVESLLSYWARLSSVHGLSTNQLASHMSAWATTQGLVFPTHLLYGRALSMCGCAPDVEKMVEVIETATGAHGLLACTLSCLRPVLCPTSTGTMKREKAWCPRCYEEDMADYGECYDRLLWAVAQVDRCPIHRLKLETTCPNCAAYQRLPRTDGDLASCHDCGANLIGTPSRWKVMLEPTLGERELGQMLSYMATVDVPAFIENAFSIYESIAVQIRRSRLLLGDHRENKEPQKRPVRRPLLRTLLKVVVGDGADLVTLLTDPIGAVSQAQVLEGFGLNFEVVRRARRPREVLTRTFAILEETVLDPNRPSLASACRRAGVSTGYARYQFADLSRRITTRWHAGSRTKFAKRAREAISVLLNTEWDKYQKGEHRSQDALVAEVVRQSSCSIRVGRLLVAARARGRPGSSASLGPCAVDLATGEEGFIGPQELARIWGNRLRTARWMLYRYVREGKLFQVAKRRKRFPAFQFTEKGRPKPIIAAMLNSVRPGDEVRFYKWMLTSHDVLHRLRPVDVLDDARSKLLPDLARIEFE